MIRFPNRFHASRTPGAVSGQGKRFFVENEPCANETRREGSSSPGIVAAQEYRRTAERDQHFDFSGILAVLGS